MGYFKYPPPVQYVCSKEEAEQSWWVWGTWLAQEEEYATLDVGVMSLSLKFCVKIT